MFNDMSFGLRDGHTEITNVLTSSSRVRRPVPRYSQADYCASPFLVFSPLTQTQHSSLRPFFDSAIIYLSLVTLIHFYSFNITTKDFGLLPANY